MPEQPQDILLLTALPPQERDCALERYRILQPCVELDVPLRHVARQHGIPLRTAARWLAQYRHHGLVGLARHGHRDRGHGRGLPPNSKNSLKGLPCARPHPPWLWSTGK